MTLNIINDNIETNSVGVLYVQGEREKEEVIENGGEEEEEINR